MNENIKSTRKRTTPPAAEIKIRQDAISSQIRKEFLRSTIAYVEAKELPFLVGKVNQTDNTRAEVRKKLLNEFSASLVAVGSGKMAIVKRP